MWCHKFKTTTTGGQDHLVFGLSGKNFCRMPTMSSILILGKHMNSTFSGIHSCSVSDVQVQSVVIKIAELFSCRFNHLRLLKLIYSGAAKQKGQWSVVPNFQGSEKEMIGIPGLRFRIPILLQHQKRFLQRFFLMRVCGNHPQSTTQWLHDCLLDGHFFLCHTLTL